MASAPRRLKAPAPAAGPDLASGAVQARTQRPSTKPDADANGALLTLARKRFRTAADAESKLRQFQLDDQQFMASNQWPANVKADRDADGRPCLTINRLPVFKRQITNQQRAAKPSIQVNPVDSGGDVETAEVLQGIIRHIEVSSQADVAYDTACDHQVTIGRGFIRIAVEWDDLNPWEQVIRIKRIRNPFSVYFDPACQEVDYADARYAFITEDVPKDEFIALYGEAALSSTDLFQMQSDNAAAWMPEGKIKVAEYFYKETSQRKIALLSNNREVDASTLTNPEVQALLVADGITVVRQREIMATAVKWVKMTGTSILDQRDWPGRFIPIIPVLGEEYDLNGSVDLRGMVRDAKDPQRMYNYWVSSETEVIALAPRAPFVVAEGQLEGYEQQWRQSNRRNFPYLLYKPKSFGGILAPAPARNAIEPPIMAIVAATKQSDNDLKAVTGIYDASLGERGPQESAKAILARQKQGDIANGHWIDNLARAIRHVGKCLIDLIPQIYDAPRVIRILGMDNQPKTVMVHADNAAAVPATDQLAEGIEGVYDLNVGRYDVTVSVGQSFQSRRQEAVQAMAALMEAYPPAAPVIGDILVENMDWPGAAIIAKRLRKMVPPEVQDVKQDDPEVQLQQLQQQFQQSSKLNEMLTSQLQHVSELLQSNQLELQSRERIVAMQEQGKLALEGLRADSETGREVARAQAEHLRLAATQQHEATQQQRDLEAAQLEQQRQLVVDVHQAAADRQVEREGLSINRAKVAVDAHKVAVDATLKRETLQTQRHIAATKPKPAPKRAK